MNGECLNFMVKVWIFPEGRIEYHLFPDIGQWWFDLGYREEIQEVNDGVGSVKSFEICSFEVECDSKDE